MKKLSTLLLLFLPLFTFAQSSSGDAKQILRSIAEVNEYRSPLLPLLYESRASIMYTREELQQKKIRSISECLDNSWGGVKTKQCIKTSFDKSGNVTSVVKTDSTGKVVLSYVFANKVDAKGNVTSSQITMKPALTIITVTQQFNENGQLVKREFKAVMPPSPDEAPKEVRVDEKPKPEESLDYTELYTYDKGLLVEYRLQQGFTTEVITLVRDAKGQVTERRQVRKTKNYYLAEIMNEQTEWRDTLAVFVQKFSYTYDPSTGYLFSIDHSRSDFPDKGTSIYRYDKDGRITHLEQTYDNTGYNSRELSYFDEKGRKVKVESYGGKTDALYNSSLIEHATLANGNVTETWHGFANTGYTETVMVFDKKGMLKENSGNYVGHTTGQPQFYRNTFRTTWAYEFYP